MKELNLEGNAVREEIITQLKQVVLPEHIVMNKFVFHHDIPHSLSISEFAINPVKQVPTKSYCTSLKDGEYWAMDLPVVISPDISDDSAIIAERNIGAVNDFKEKQTRGIFQFDQLMKDNSKEEIQKKYFQ